MIKRSLVFQTRDSRGHDCALVIETAVTQCPRCKTGMQSFLPAASGDLVVGRRVGISLVCGDCQSVIEEANIEILSPTSSEVGIATVKAIASDIFTAEEFQSQRWQDFVPHELRRDSDGKPMIVAQGAVLHGSVRLQGPLVIDKHSKVGAGTALGPYTGIVRSQVGKKVALEECRVMDSAVMDQNWIKKHLLKNTVIPEGRFG
jgi:hypothetical protein